MKRRLAIAVALTAVFVAGCAPSNSTAPTTTPPSATAMPSQPPTTTEPNRSVTYSAQVELPFGDFINHPAGLAVDGASNVYVLDSKYGQVWKQAAGTNRPRTLGFEQIGPVTNVAVDKAGNLYVTDGFHQRLMKLIPGVSNPTMLPTFNELPVSYTHLTLPTNREV